jgi:hypothetical protein
VANRRLDVLETPPRFVLARTRHGNTWRFRSGLDAAVVSMLARYAARESALSSALAPPERLPALLRTLNPSKSSDERWGSDSPSDRFFRWAIFRARVADPLTIATLLNQAGMLEMPWSDRPHPSKESQLGIALLGDVFDFH